MLLEKLRVIHLHKSSVKALVKAPGSDALSGAYYLDTCQRTLWVCTKEAFDASRSSCDWSAFQILAGVQAYGFLLRVATGLESRVLGETDVFGQLKEAWSKTSHCLDGDVDFWVQKIFEDTKEIRSRHLQHLGGGFLRNLNS